MTQHSKTKPCPDCGTPISTEPSSFSFRDDGPSFTFPPPTKCDDCTRRDEAAAIEQNRIETLATEWAKIAPPLYRTSDTSRFPQQLQDALDAFDPDSTTGIGIRGASGQCKTRFAYALLHRAHIAGERTLATKATAIAAIAANQWDSRLDKSVGFSLISSDPHPTIGDSAQKHLRQFKTCRWLLIDDIGKEKITDRAEVELYDILEERTSNNLPTIWTLNMSAKKLKTRLSEDRSEPILRRLIEFSDVITLD